MEDCMIWYGVEENTDPPNWNAVWIGGAILAGFVLVILATEFLC